MLNIMDLETTTKRWLVYLESINKILKIINFKFMINTMFGSKLCTKKPENFTDF